MSGFAPGAVATVGGQRCVVLRDAVAHALPPADDVVVIERFDGRLVYCAAEELKRARKLGPGLPAYGFWQILLHSEALDKAERLQAVYFDGKNGQYLYQEAPSVFFTGEIRAGRWIAAAGYPLDPASGRVVACDAGRLRLPRKAVLSFEERERRQAARKLRLALHFAAVAVFLGAAWFAYDGKRRGHDAGLQTAHAALELHAEALEARKAGLRETRVGEWPDQRRALDDLLYFAIALEEFALPETPLDGPQFEVRADFPHLRLPPMLTTVVTTVGHRRDGLLSLYRERRR